MKKLEVNKIISEKLERTKRRLKEISVEENQRAENLRKLIKICQVLMEKYPGLKELSHLKKVGVAGRCLLVSGKLHIHNISEHSEEITHEGLFETANASCGFAALDSFHEEINEDNVLKSILKNLR